MPEFDRSDDDEIDFVRLRRLAMDPTSDEVIDAETVEESDASEEFEAAAPGQLESGAPEELESARPDEETAPSNDGEVAPIQERADGRSARRSRSSDKSPDHTEPEQRRPAAPSSPESGMNLRIGIWGAPRAGKTTYLRALRFAAQQPVLGTKWNISGCDRASTQFLIDGVQEVVKSRTYPAPTLASSGLAWKFQGVKQRKSRNALWARLMEWAGEDTPEPDTEFIVEVQDVPGEVYAGSSEAERHLLHDTVVDQLLAAQGIVYLFDPVGTKAADTNSFDFYFQTVEHLKTRAAQRNMLVGSGQLPHHVSVCVTKLDKAEVFDAAMAAGVIYQTDGDPIPQVPREFGPELLQRLCDDTGSEFVCEQLENDFVPSRVKYFVTSATGFYLKDGQFDRTDFTNEDEGGKLRSKGAPINVLEPIITLQQRISSAEGGLG